MCHIETSNVTSDVTLHKCNIWIAKISEAMSEYSIRYFHLVHSPSRVFMHMQGCYDSQTPVLPKRTEVSVHRETKIDSLFPPKIHISIQFLF